MLKAITNRFWWLADSLSGRLLHYIRAVIMSNDALRLGTDRFLHSARACSGEYLQTGYCAPIHSNSHSSTRNAVA